MSVVGFGLNFFYTPVHIVLSTCQLSWAESSQILERSDRSHGVVATRSGVLPALGDMYIRARQVGHY